MQWVSSRYVLCHVTLLLYGILEAVNRTVALLAASFNLVGLVFEALERHILGVNAALVFHGVYCLLGVNVQKWMGNAIQPAPQRASSV
jgi:hypothetical protein